MIRNSTFSPADDSIRNWAMRHKCTVWIFFVMILIFLFPSCGGSGSGGGGVASNTAGGGIGGTGISVSSVGPITAKGSITVNGVEFETTTADIFLDGKESSAGDLLKVGMVVQVQGTLNDDNITGNATTVRFDDSVQGPITSISGNILVILGQTVLVDSQTVFDSSIPGGVSNLMEGDFLEVSGEPDELGRIRATFMQRKAPTDNYETTGLVFNQHGTMFMINNLMVHFDSAVLKGFGMMEPADGDMVAVTGTELDPVTGDLIATEIEKKSPPLNEGEDLEAEGFVSTLNGSSFTMNIGSGLVTVESNTQTQFEGGVLTDIQAGTKLEVEGQISGGILIAENISFE